VERESALISKAVERSAARVPASRNAILTLIQKRTGLLSFDETHGESYRIFFDNYFAGIGSV
jgi:hypothetical protein